MIAILTGDVVNSRSVSPEIWIDTLKQVFSNITNNLPGHWDIYRGDSFQVKVEPYRALHSAIMIKAALKQYKGLDVRIGIGVGEEGYTSNVITESNGSAFVNSGKCFDSLGNSGMAIMSSNNHFNRTINLMLSLAGLTMDNWTPLTSKIIKATLENPDLNQTELANLLGKKQSHISIGLKRGGFDVIEELMLYFEGETLKYD